MFIDLDNLCDTIYHYKAANKVLKSIIHHIDVVTKPPENLIVYFFQAIFHENSQSTHL